MSLHVATRRIGAELVQVHTIVEDVESGRVDAPSASAPASVIFTRKVRLSRRSRTKMSVVALLSAAAESKLLALLWNTT